MATSEVTRLFIVLTVIDSLVLPTRLKKANPPRPNTTYRLLSRADHPRPPDPIKRLLVAPRRGFHPP